VPQLKVIVPDQDPRTVELTGDAVVGRVEPADIVVADPKVSRRHCRFAKSGAGWIVEDLGSSNGTRIGGVAVKSRALRDGDQIEVGRTTLVFEASPARVFEAPVRRSARDRLGARRRS